MQIRLKSFLDPAYTNRSVLSKDSLDALPFPLLARLFPLRPEQDFTVIIASRLP